MLFLFSAGCSYLNDLELQPAPKTVSSSFLLSALDDVSECG